MPPNCYPQNYFSESLLEKYTIRVIVNSRESKLFSKNMVLTSFATDLNFYYASLGLFSFASPLGNQLTDTFFKINSKKLLVAIFLKAKLVEVYQQTCGIEHCQAHTDRAQRNYITLATLTLIKKSERRCVEQLSIYAQKWEIMKDAIASFMKRLLFNPTLI
jgi:hypothetical protein